jgi:DNA-binding winged helix-turn-helix (wHTH) protein/tetratricopeptide (TPR) repeat protein
LRDPTPTRRIVRFASFEVDLESGELRKAGRRIAVQDQPFRILEQLLARPGQVVTRDELRQRLWPENTFVDFERGLNAAVKRLRDTLGDSADSPAFIETLSRRGYRFIAPIEDGHRGEALRQGGTAPTGAGPAPAALDSTDVAAQDGPGQKAAGRRPAWIFVAGAAAICVAIVLGIAWTQGWVRPSDADGNVAAVAPIEPSGSRIVAVAVFDNRTGDASLDPFGQLAADALTRTLAGITDAQIAPRVVAGAAVTNGQLSADAAPSASLLVRGAYYRQGSDLMVQAAIHDPSTGRLLHAPDAVSKQPASTREILARLEQSIGGAVAIHFDDFFGGLQVISDPPSLEVYREYRVGLEIFESDYRRMHAHLDRALALEPGFWLPTTIKFFAYLNVGEDAQAESALAHMEAGLDRRSSAERLWIEFLRARWEGRNAQALRLIEDLEPRMPRSMGVNHNIVELSLRLNRPRAAVETYDKLPSSPRSLRNSVGAYRFRPFTSALHVLGEYERELSEARRAQRYAPGVLAFAMTEVRALAALGRLDEVRRAIDTSLSITPTSGTAGGIMEEAVVELRAHGHRQAALEMAGHAVEWYRSRAAGPNTERNRAGLARSLYLAERWAEASELFSSLSAESPADAEYTGILGVIAARRGDAARAQALSDQLAKVSTGNWRTGAASAILWRACIAAVLGERQRAVDLLREAFARGAPYGPYIHSSPEFESLADYPPYVELLRPKG